MLAKRAGVQKVGRDVNAVVGSYRVARSGQVFRRWDTGGIDASEWRKKPLLTWLQAMGSDERRQPDYLSAIPLPPTTTQRQYEGGRLPLPTGEAVGSKQN